jgi:transcriptional regulator with PAS, ATPase and Fis domain
LREDLYYRLNVYTLELPPLRDRLEDLPLLVADFVREFNREHNKASRAWTKTAWMPSELTRGLETFESCAMSCNAR